MTLTKLVKEKEIKELFRSNFKMPSYGINHLIKTPPLTKNYIIVGWAFDFLLKLYVKYNNIPENMRHYYYLKTINQYWRTINYINITYDEFNLLLEGKVSENILKGSVIAAHSTMRYPSNKMRQIDPLDVKDLSNLFDIVNIDEFKANFECIINTNFDHIANLVKGAYCDLIIDHKLLDIKTTSHLYIDETILFQLIGYYILSKLYGKNDIQEIGVYFSRYGVTYLYKIKDLVNEENIPTIIDEFVSIARVKYGT